MYKIQNLILIISVITMLYPGNLLGQIEFREVFPNTIDDTNLEYIELRNIGCTNQDISGYILEDASGKKYIFDANSSIPSHENLNISRIISKIILNNTDEILYFKDSIGAIISQFTYATSIKGEKINNSNIIDMECTILDPHTGATNTGSNSTGSDNDTSSGIVDDNTTGSGDTNTGSTDIPTDSGSLHTGSTDNSTGSSSTNTGSSSGSEIIFSGTIFPEIIPSIQHPSNAIFSGGEFDCTNQNPCRINLTFDSIFTPSFLEKNYTCEVITETGSLNDCNPNTLYFISGSSITFRLSSKLELTQSVSKTWNIIYKNSEIIHSSGATHSGITDTFSGEIITSSGIYFPEIIPVFQNYTNAVFSGNMLICTNVPCRLNMNFENIFTGSFLEKDYTCEVRYSGSSYGCNPPQLYLEGTGSIDIRLIHKTSNNEKNISLGVLQNQLTTADSGVPSNSFPVSADTNPPIAIIEYDGKLKSYHEQISEYEMNCHTETCAINLTAEKSYDREGGKIEFLWFYGLHDIKTSKDPGERKYGLGDHQIWLRVIDTSGNVAHVRYNIHVLGSKKNDPIAQKPKKIKNPVNKENTKVVKIQKPKKQIKKMVFFEEPIISSQKSKFTNSDRGYLCKSTTKNCSLNLKIDNPQKGIIYTWLYQDGSILDSKNPKSKSFTPGKHIVKIIAGYSPDTPIWTKDILVEVIKIQKPKKIKKPKPKKIVQISGSNKEKIELIDTQKPLSSDSKKEEPFPMAVWALIGGIMPIYFLKKSLSKTKIKI